MAKGKSDRYNPPMRGQLGGKPSSSMKNNVDSKQATDHKGAERIPMSMSEQSSGVIPKAMLNKHGLAEDIPGDMEGDPKKQSAYAVKYDDDIEPS